MNYDFLRASEQVIMSGKANKTVGAGMLGAEGGELILTNERLVFKAHSFNVGKKFLEINLSDIAVTQNTLNILVPTPNTIRVNLRDGSGYTFVVVGKDKDAWKKAIAEIASENAPAESEPVVNSDEIAVDSLVDEIPVNENKNLDEKKNKIFAWVMATIPVTGIIIARLLGFGWACLVLNIVVGYLDEKSLREQGVDTSSFGKFSFLVPYYLYKRAKALGDNLAYFIVWLVLFALTLF